jgi:hypothetical protein
MVSLPPTPEEPQTQFNRGRLHLLQNEAGEALAAYLAGIGQILEPNRSIPASLLQDEIDFLVRINDGRPLPKAHDLVRRLLFVAIIAASQGAIIPEEIDRRRPELISRFAAGSDKGVLIVAGGNDGLSAGRLALYGAIVGRALAGTSGWVISGGTTSGIPGLVGKTATAVAPKGRRKFFLQGYCANQIGPGTEEAGADYDAIAHTGADESGLGQPLMVWADLLLAGIRPGNVRLLGLNGDGPAAFELRLALALGARVGVVGESGRGPNAILADPLWGDHPRLVPLPADGIDGATIWAFVRNSRFELPVAELDRLAKSFHRDYLKMASSRVADRSPEMELYYELRPDLRDSNRELVRYAAEILRTEGFKLAEHQGPIEEIGEQQFTAEQIERMAELEHGRWCIERLTNRWVSGEAKDTKLKVTPWLKPYAALTDAIKQLDREVIQNYPRFFKAGGYAIVKA